MLGKENEAPQTEANIEPDALNDADNPRNWPPLTKWTSVCLLSFIEFLTPFASMMYAATIPQASKDLHSPSGSVNSFSMTIYILGFAIGPLVIAPLSDVYGRIRIYRFCMVLFLIFTLACGFATDIAMFIVFRFLAGCTGAAPIALGGAMIKELFAEDARGNAMSIYFAGPVAGPLLGPIIGGFVGGDIGWRWTFWVVCIASAVTIAAAFFILRETHPPTIQRRKQRKIRTASGNHATNPKYPNLSKFQEALTILLHAWSQPFRMIFGSVYMFIFLLFIVQIFGALNLVASTQSTIYEDQYGFNPGEAGLTYLGSGLGSLAGVILMSTVSDRAYIYLKKRRSGITRPRDRLPFLLLGGPLMAVGLFWYGWSLQAKNFWLVPLIGLFIGGAGVIAVVVPSNLYLLELFPEHAASAIAANTIARSIGGSTIPLAGIPLYRTCGFGWGNSLLAFLTLLLWVAPLLFFVTNLGPDRTENAVQGEKEPRMLK